MKKIFLVFIMLFLLLASCNKEVKEEKKTKDFEKVEDIYFLSTFRAYEYESYDYYEEADLACFLVNNVDVLLSANKIKLYDSRKNEREFNALKYSLDYYDVDSKYKVESDALFYLKSIQYFCLDENGKEYYKDFVAIIQKDDQFVVLAR